MTNKTVNDMLEAMAKVLGWDMEREVAHEQIISVAIAMLENWPKSDPSDSRGEINWEDGDKSTYALLKQLKELP